MKITKLQVLLLSLLLLLGIIVPTTASAQRNDGFFKKYNDNYENRTEGIDINDGGGIGHYGIGETVPLTSGLLIVTALGAGYAISRRKRSCRDASNASKTALLALAILLITPSCKKKIAEPVNDTVQTNGVSITLNVDGNNSKVIVDPNDPAGYATVTFEAGDIVYVGYNNNYVGYLTYTVESEENKYFSGSVNIDAPVGEQPLHFYFLGGKGFTPTIVGNTATVNISDQTSKYPISSYNQSTRPYDGAGSYSAKLICKCSIMKFNVTTPSSSPICITGMNNKVTVDFTAPSDADNGFDYSANSEDGGLIKMKGGSGSPATKWAIVLPQGELSAGSAGSIYANNGTYTTFTGSRPLIHAIESNKYYHESGDVISMTVNTATDIVDLGDVTANKTITNGQTVTGTLGRNVEISIANGATITLENATINRTSNSYPGLTCQGSATINLKGNNTTNGGSLKAGIQIGESGTTLTINGPGSLSATGGLQSAGIGLSRAWSAGTVRGGNIVINGGTITASGSPEQWGAGIGTGVCYNSTVSMGDITINGGNVTAIGGENGSAGIGTSYTYVSASSGVGNIIINGGTVTATGTEDAAAIGTGHTASGNYGGVGNITISGGTVTATCGPSASTVIGRTTNGTCGDISITGTPTVTLNNPNISEFPVSIRSSYMNTENNFVMGDLNCGTTGDMTFTKAGTHQISSYEFGFPDNAQQFVYRPKN